MSVRLFWANALCILIAASAVWANYHIVEQTRVLNVALRDTSRQIQTKVSDLKEAQVTYVALSRPGRVQKLAVALLGMHDGATYQVASFTRIPMRGSEETVLPISDSSAGTLDSVVRISAAKGDR